MSWREEWLPLQYSCLENPVDRGAWQTIVHSVAVRPDWSDSMYAHRYLNKKTSEDQRHQKSLDLWRASRVLHAQDVNGEYMEGTDYSSPYGSSCLSPPLVGQEWTRGPWVGKAEAWGQDPPSLANPLPSVSTAQGPQTPVPHAAHRCKQMLSLLLKTEAYWHRTSTSQTVTPNFRLTWNLGKYKLMLKQLIT